VTVFEDYAGWYDLFYRDKDYRAEAKFVSDVLRTAGGAGRHLLEVGCGTGAHARWLVEAGWKVLGLDRSARMLARARQRLAEVADAPGSASFETGDARDFDVGQKFDAAVSLFHVMSYQAGPGELQAAMRSVRRHLHFGGLFLFDFWYGPAVLAQRPERRVRVVEDTRFQVRRTAIPTVRENEQVVEVRYDFEVTDKLTGAHRQVEELHPMRFLMPKDLGEMGGETGFALVALRAWMTEREPDEGSWSAFALLRTSE
jgi:SAM-dependent methyltransferase